MTLGETIKKLRKSKKITQKELGTIIKKKEITIRKYESNSIVPTLETLNDIAKALECNVEILTRASLSEEENQTTALSHIYDFIDYYAVKNGKEFMLSEKYSSETLEFAHNVISLLENKIWKIENDMDKAKE